jgi:hypothetical protein
MTESDRSAELSVKEGVSARSAALGSPFVGTTSSWSPLFGLRAISFVRRPFSPARQSVSLRRIN